MGRPTRKARKLFRAKNPITVESKFIMKKEKVTPATIGGRVIPRKRGSDISFSSSMIKLQQ
jgi:hypothetical protein